MAKYSKRKDGLYVANRTINGKRKVFYGKTCKEVDEKIKTYLTTGEKGAKLKAIYKRWWEYLEKNSSPQTMTTYHAGAERALDRFGECYLCDISQQEIQGYIWDFASKGYAKGTVELEVAILKSLFRYARDAGQIKASPVVDIKIPKGLKKGKRPALTAEQQAKVEALTEGQYGLLGHLLLYTGLRKGEAAALTWQDVDLKAGLIHIDKKVNYAGNIGILENHLKSENGLRDIPIPSKLRPYLTGDHIGLMFPGRDGQPLHKGSIQYLWDRYCIAAGLVDDDGKPNVVMHQLRHTYATLCLEAGVEIKTCAQWMGDTEDVVYKIYQEVRPEQQQVEAKKFDDYTAKRKAQ